MDRRAPAFRSRRWLQVAFWAVMVLLLLAGIVFDAGENARARLKAAYPPPGRLVDVGEYSLHLQCIGTGRPIVLMEAGAGDMGLIWSLVQPEVGKFTTACVYDRAGHGWSDPGPIPFTASRIVQDLHMLLMRGAGPGPYVLVGHSLGGAIVRLFLKIYFFDVSGMVLVDSAHEEQLDRLPAALRDAQERVVRSNMRQLRLAAILARFGMLALRPSVFPTRPQLSPHAAAAVRAVAVSDAKWLEAMQADQQAVGTMLNEVRTAGGSFMYGVPLIVLARGRPDALPPQASVTPDVLADAEKAWRDMQSELATRSTRGRLVVAEQSGHYIQLDQPNLVIDAIRQVVESVRP